MDKDQNGTNTVQDYGWPSRADAVKVSTGFPVNVEQSIASVKSCVKRKHISGTRFHRVPTTPPREWVTIENYRDTFGKLVLCIVRNALPEQVYQEFASYMGLRRSVLAKAYPKDFELARTHVPAHEPYAAIEEPSIPEDAPAQTPVPPQVPARFDAPPQVPARFDARGDEGGGWDLEALERKKRKEENEYRFHPKRRKKPIPSMCPAENVVKLRMELRPGEYRYRDITCDFRTH